MSQGLGKYFLGIRSYNVSITAFQRHQQQQNIIQHNN